MFVVTEENPGRTTTIMNRGGHFTVVREPTDPRWRMEREALPNRGEALCSLQSRQFMEGQVTIELVNTIKGYWSLRNLSNLGETWPAGRRTDLVTKEDAIAAAILWWEGDPARREVVFRT
jgi:hypothetical protein